MNGNTFTETHSRRTKRLTFELLTILIIGLLLNLLASIFFDWIYNSPVLWSKVKIATTFVVIVFTFLSTFFMIRLRMPVNAFRRVAYCNLLWDIKHRKLIESIYYHPTGYNPQQFSFQIYEMLVENEPELLKGLGEKATKDDMQIITDILGYLIFFWLGWDALKPTYRLGLKPKTVDLEQISKIVSNNSIVALATRHRKVGWIPPDIIIELPENVSLSVPKSLNTLNIGELAITNQYFSIHIRYNKPHIRSLSSMWMGPAPSIMGMPVNPFFLEKERKPERRLELSSLRVAFCNIIFEVKFNHWMLLRAKTFYKYMEWGEQLSNHFLDFFDWGRNIEVALKSRNEEIYEILKMIYEMLKEIEARTEENSKKR